MRDEVTREVEPEMESLSSLKDDRFRKIGKESLNRSVNMAKHVGQIECQMLGQLVKHEEFAPLS